MTSNDMDWQVGLSKISQRTNKILDSGHWNDCVFLVGNENRQQTIKAHRLILAMSSPVFEAMFYGSMAEKEEKQIEILDVQPQAFKALLKYIYADEIHFTSFDQVCEICYAAKKYMIPPLVEECTKYIWKDLHPGNVCRAYAFVRLFEEPQLLDQCMSMIKSRTEDVISDLSFEETDICTMKSILAQETLNISELGLWEGILRWGKQECIRQSLEQTSHNLRKALQELLPLIRFLTMSPTQFANGPALSNILSQEECFGLLMNISSPGVASMPQNFSPITVNRKPPPRQLQQQQLACQSSHSYSHDLDEPEEQLVCNCAGPLSDTFTNDQLIDCALSFSVDRDICIIGVILPTQLKPPDPRSFDNFREHQSFQRDQRMGSFGNSVGFINKYPELIYAFLQDADGCRLTYTHFSARVPWESSMEVLFNRPVYISPNMTYKIVVVLNKMGRYPLYTTVSRVLVGDVNFTFEEDEESEIRESIVKTLIFKTIVFPKRSCPGKSPSSFVSPSSLMS